MKRLKEKSEDLFNKWNGEMIEMSGEEVHIYLVFDARPPNKFSQYNHMHISRNKESKTLAPKPH